MEEFKKRILTGDHLRFYIQAFAYDSGFNSKTAFYRLFLKMDGISPGEYIKRQARYPDSFSRKPITLSAFSSISFDSF
jgi:AraC-like DNA-binding protein